MTKHVPETRQWASTEGPRRWVAERQPFLRRHSFSMPTWAIPMLYSATAMVIGLLLPRVESRWLPEWGLSLGTSAAVAMDSSIAAGMISLTGIVFALAFVMVQFGTVAYSPRLVPWIARDPLMMHAVGIFTATFLYAIAALAWVDRKGSGHVPFFSGWLVVIMLLASVAVFIGLVHRLSFLQVHRILVFAAERGRRLIDELYPPLEAAPAPATVTETAKLPVTQTLLERGSPSTIQAIDTAALFEIACEADAVIEVVAAVGDTVAEGVVLLRVLGAREQIAEPELSRTFIMGNERTFEQDPKYAVLILADIAIRALSPAVNDPATAVQALDHIEDLLLRLGRRRLEVGDFRDRNGDLRLVLPMPAWEDFLSLGLAEIRHYGASSVRVMRRMRALLGDLIEALPPERRRALRLEHDRLEATIERTFDDEEEVLLASVEDRQGLGSSRRRRSGE